MQDLIDARDVINGLIAQAIWYGAKPLARLLMEWARQIGEAISPRRRRLPALPSFQVTIELNPDPVVAYASVPQPTASIS